MAATYTTGTINAANAGAVGLAMAQKIRDDVAAHAAWDLVEEYTPASSAVTWYVFKCLGTANGLGSDFFVVLGLTISTGELRAFVCESYNSASHIASNFGTFNHATGTVMDASGRNPYTFTLSTTVLPSTVGAPKWFSWLPSGTSTKWWIIAAEDTISIAFSGGSNGFFHFGAYTYLGQLSNTFPLQGIGSSDILGVITRNPAIASATPNGYGNCFSIEGGGYTTAQNYLTALGFQGFWQYNDKLQNNQRPVAEVGMTLTSQSGLSDWPNVYGYVVGKQQRMRVSSQNMPGGMAFGDAFALNGTLWVPYNVTIGKIWNTGVAA